jgi:hypothetical protein
MSAVLRTPRHAVRLSIPAAVSFDLDRFTKTIANLAEAVGCRTCISGADCTFNLHNDWLVDPEGRLQPILPQATFEGAG